MKAILSDMEGARHIAPVQGEESQDTQDDEEISVFGRELEHSPVTYTPAPRRRVQLPFAPSPVHPSLTHQASEELQQLLASPQEDLAMSSPNIIPTMSPMPISSPLRDSINLMPIIGPPESQSPPLMMGENIPRVRSPSMVMLANLASEQLSGYKENEDDM